MEKKEEKKLIQFVRDVMEHAIELKVPIKVSIKTGENLYELKEIQI
jgi:DNA polymerase I-like protein with 3'-5' exonuclease and polymerase domains